MRISTISARFVFVSLFSFFFLLASYSVASAETAIHGTLPPGDHVWTPAGSPYIVSGVVVPTGATLTVEPGTSIKLAGLFALDVFGTAFIGSEGGEKVIITSYTDDTVGGDTNNDGSDTAPTPEDWCTILTRGDAVLSINNAVIRYGGCKNWAQVTNVAGELTIEDSELIDGGEYGLFTDGGTTTVTNSEITRAGYIGIVYRRGSIILSNNSIHNNREYGIFNSSLDHTVINATNNWWGSDAGPFHVTSNPAGLGNNAVSDYVTFDPWLHRNPLEEICVDCASNVLFLPGMKGSQLYMPDEDGSGEDKLWLPSLFSHDVDNLNLSNQGVSVNRVYTKDGEVLYEDPAGNNIYKGFIDRLAELKTAGTIENYDAFAYDWRLNAEDLVRNGTPHADNEIRSALDKAVALAETAKNKKVTIIAHSYGGLFAKALMMELEERGLSDKVDKVVLVGTPQMGTPLALLSMFYGYDESLLYGAMVSRQDARALAENMPSSYALLPSKKYFSRADNPFVTFSSERTRHQSFLEAYGERIQSYDEFKDFLVAAGDGRSKPAKSDVELENVLNGTLFEQAAVLHEKLDNWTPPSNIELIQIAGWGLDTISGVEYTEKEETRCFPSGRILSCAGTGEYEPVYEPQFTVDGDKVGVAPSALMLPEASNVKRYWVDLYRYNDDNVFDGEHKNILEVSSIQEFLSNIITDSYEVAELPNFIKTSRPDDYANAKPRLRMSLYSPLDIHLYDAQGNHTGPKTVTIEGQEQVVLEEGIPNSYYYQFGERKYVGFDESESIRVEMEGYAEGSYTLKLEEIAIMETGEVVTEHTTFENLPTTANTEVTLEIPETGLSDMSDLTADIDGDGTQDYEVEPVPNGTATLEPIDMEAPTTAVSLAGVAGQNSWYVSDVTVTLTVTENEGGSEVAKTEYSLDNGLTWSTYSVPFVLSNEGSHLLLFASTDMAGNKEAVQSASIQIDKTTPEARLQFNPSTQELDIIGTDALSEVAVVNSSLSATLTDQAGHTLVLKFTKEKNKERRIVRTLESLSYDGIVKTLPKTLLRYKWHIDKKNGSFKMLAAYFRTDNKKLESHYRPKKNITIIMSKPEDLDDSDNDEKSDSRPTKEKLPGLVIPSLVTERGEIKIIY